MKVIVVFDFPSVSLHTETSEKIIGSLEDELMSISEQYQCSFIIDDAVNE